MGRLANISGREAAKAFQKAGWEPLGQVGSYLVLVKPGVRVNLSIPQHRELSVGTLRALIRAAGMSVDELLSILLLDSCRAPARPLLQRVTLPALENRSAGRGRGVAEGSGFDFAQPPELVKGLSTLAAF